MYFFEEPVKFVDENGTVKDKKNLLSSEITREEYKSDYGYVNNENDIQTYFPKTLSEHSGIILDAFNYKIELSPIRTNIQMSAPAELLSDDIPLDRYTAASKKQILNINNMLQDTVEYANAFGTHTNLRYTTAFNGFKEDLVLTEKPNTNRFSFKIKTNGLRLISEDEHYYLCDPLTGEKNIKIGDLVIYDSKAIPMEEQDNTDPSFFPEKPPLEELTGEERDALYFPDKRNETEYHHHYEMQTITNNQEYILTIVADEAYLNDVNTVYPVIVDPSFTISNAGMEDATIYSNMSSNQGYAPNMFAGNHSGRFGGSQGVARSLVKFPGLFSNSTFQSIHASNISSVKYRVRDTMCEGDAVWIDCHRMTTNWSESSVTYNSTIWNAFNKDLLSDNLVSYNNGSANGFWYTFNITEAVRDWKNGLYGGTGNHYGIMLKAYQESNSAKTFATSDSAEYSPSIVIEYGTSVPVTNVRVSPTCREVDVNWWEDG